MTVDNAPERGNGTDTNWARLLSATTAPTHLLLSIQIEHKDVYVINALRFFPTTCFIPTRPESYRQRHSKRIKGSIQKYLNEVNKLAVGCSTTARSS